MVDSFDGHGVVVDVDDEIAFARADDDEIDGAESNGLEGLPKNVSFVENESDSGTAWNFLEVESYDTPSMWPAGLIGDVIRPEQAFLKNLFSYSDIHPCTVSVCKPTVKDSMTITTRVQYAY